MNEHQIENKPVATWPVLLATVTAIIFWLANFFYGNSLEPEQRGIFGDMFGAVNSIFSGFAFVGVIYAISIQRHEIAIAKQDIKYTKEILNDQKQQLSKQNQETQKQSFETTFFQLLRLFSDITNQIDLQKKSDGVISNTTGKDVFPVFLIRLSNAYNPTEKALYGGHDFEASYNEFYQHHNSELGHYFRTVYNIFKFIKNSNIENKKFYSNIVRAQLSDAEVALLFHNGLSKFGREQFKPLLEEFAILKYVNDSDILDKKLKSKYKKNAFI